MQMQIHILTFSSHWWKLIFLKTLSQVDTFENSFHVVKNRYLKIVAHYINYEQNPLKFSVCVSLWLC